MTASTISFAALIKMAQADKAIQGREFSAVQLRCSFDVEETRVWGCSPTPRAEAEAMFAARWEQRGAQVLAILDDGEPWCLKGNPSRREVAVHEESVAALAAARAFMTHPDWRPGRKPRQGWAKKLGFGRFACPNCASRKELAFLAVRALVLADSSAFRAAMNRLEDRFQRDTRRAVRVGPLPSTLKGIACAL
jgi:hypothetical protein